MRISILSDDPGNQAFLDLPPNRVPVVYVNGERVHHCFTADSDTGYALIACQDDDHNLILNGSGDDVARRVLFGIVTIEFETRE